MRYGIAAAVPAARWQVAAVMLVGWLFTLGWIVLLYRRWWPDDGRHRLLFWVERTMWVLSVVGFAVITVGWLRILFR